MTKVCTAGWLENGIGEKRETEFKKEKGGRVAHCRLRRVTKRRERRDE